jgi:hypothetical protein
VPLRCPDILIAICGAHLIVAVGATDRSDGLHVTLTPDRDGTFNVTPVVVSTEGHERRARRRMRTNPAYDDHADLLIAALESLLFRRVLPAERVS